MSDCVCRKCDQPLSNTEVMCLPCHASAISDGAKWVSVEERVPGEEVLTCTDEREVGMGWFDPLDGWRESGSGMRFADMGRNIDYWMPLPEAPK